MSAPTIGCALMVRNEAANVPGALTNLLGRGLREIVVLDTGSTDRTVRLATRPGVRVVEEPWRTERLGDVTTLSDFAAGRNRSIELCDSSDYVLLSDADYRWPKGVIERMIVKLAEHPELVVGYTMLHNAQGSGDAPEDVVSGKRRRGDAYPVIQLVKRTATDGTYLGPHYKNRVHELADEWAEKQIAAGGLSGLVGSVAHYGHTPSACELKNKTSRNFAVLLKWAEEDPRAAQPFVYLGTMLLGEDIYDLDRAGKALAHAYSLRHEPNAKGHLVRLAHGVVMWLTKSGKPAEAMAAIDELESIHQPHPDFHCLRGFVYEACRRWREAAHFLRLSLDPEKRRGAVVFVAEAAVRKKLADCEARARAAA